MIDVSQAVEHSHPNALEFLRIDATNITDFFRRKGVQTMSVRELFDFCTDPTLPADLRDTYLERMQARIAERKQNPLPASDAAEARVGPSRP